MVRRQRVGCWAGPANGARTSAGACWTSLARIGPRSTPRCPTPARSRTGSISCGWATPPSTRSAAESNSRPWAPRLQVRPPLSGAQVAGVSVRERHRLWAGPAAGLLEAGDHYGEVRDAWHAKETLRSIYDIDDADVGAATDAQLADDLQDSSLPAEVNRLGRTISRWRAHISVLAHRPGHQRRHRRGQQPRQAGQAGRVRVHQLRELPDPGCCMPASPTERLLSVPSPIAFSIWFSESSFPAGTSTTEPSSPSAQSVTVVGTTISPQTRAIRGGGRTLGVRFWCVLAPRSRRRSSWPLGHPTWPGSPQATAPG